MHSCGSTRLKALESDAKSFKRCRKSLCGHHTVRARGVDLVTDKYLALEEGARRYDNALTSPHLAKVGEHTRDPYSAVFGGLGEYVHYLRLHESEVLFLFYRGLHQGLIGVSVRLHSLGVHRRALTEVEGARLYSRLVRRIAHLTAECVYLKDEMSLRTAADRRVARHIADRVKIDSKEDGGNTHTA